MTVSDLLLKQIFDDNIDINSISDSSITLHYIWANYIVSIQIMSDVTKFILKYSIGLLISRLT